MSANDGNHGQLDDDEALVAIVGMSGRFPGAPDLARFWQNIASGVDSVRRFTDEELLALGESPAALRDPAYVRVCPYLDDADHFDAGFFGFSPKEAAITDPQHRLFLEVAWEALENAGYEPSRAGVVGVFASTGQNSYLMHHLVTNPELMESVGEWLLRHTGNDMNFLATRVSYEFDLRGPSMNVQTACSSSLLALHLATSSLLGRECDMALVGGSVISLPQRGYLYKEGEILADDGHCRPFDARARGTLFGSGAGAIVVKRLVDARRDGDTILAVVRGSAVNNDGSQKVGYLAPSVEGQARAVAEALAVSGVDAHSITLIEAHGTGTVIGDPIEVGALTQAFRAHTDERGFCAIGSLKSNIGHLGEAAGVAGLIKTVLALGHGQLPPSANYETPNPNIDFAASPFYVSDRLKPWPRERGPRRAGITALGAGGTNVHVIVEEAPAATASGPSRAWQLIPLSARSGAALASATARLAAHLESNPATSLADVAYTLQVGRRKFDHRRIAVCRDAADAARVLAGAEPKRLISQTTSRREAEVVFSFPGGGAQHAGMGRELYESEPVYSAAIDECLAHVAGELDVDLRALMYPPAGASLADASAKLESPSRALPALFATEYALAKLLQSWGLAPAAMIGHSMGEYVAACLAGVFSARDGMRLVAVRGRLFETLPPGGMLAVPLPADELARVAPDEMRGLSIAAANAPGLCVASGPVAAIAALEARLVVREVDAKRVHIAVAAHSTMLEPILAEFERFCRTITFRAPTLPFVSNLTGTWITEREATDPTYWVRHLRGTVRFADGMNAIVAQKKDRVVLEIGPGRTLTSLAAMQTTKPAAAFPTLPHPSEADAAAAFLLTTLGQAWMAGVELDWDRFHGAGAKRRRVPLPTYPFERQRYWIERGAAAAPGDALIRKADVAEWFWLPSWTRTPAPAAEASSSGGLFFVDEAGLGEALAARRPGAIKVRAGAGFARVGDDTFTIAPGRREDMDALFSALRAAGRLPDEIVHAWTVTATPVVDALAGYDRAFDVGFASVLHLAQALALEDRPARLTVVSNRLHRIGGEAEAEPWKALVLGPTKVAGTEVASLAARSVDVVWPGAPSSTWQRARVVEQLLAELAAPRAIDLAREQKLIAWRGAERFVQTFEPAPTSRPRAPASTFRDGGVYLITGGLGGLGAMFAAHLSRTARAKIVLVGRTARADDAAARALEAAGAEVLVQRADVTSLADMRAVVAATRARFGAVHGIIHAAGVLDDQLLQLKTAESAARVLAPKVKGALVLDALAKELAPQLELFVMMSSVSAILGFEGQVDYVAANAFLDALAHDRAGRAPELTLSIDWTAWRDVGMAAVIAARGQAPVGGRVAGPSTGAEWLGEKRGRAFERTLRRDDWWLLAEHVVKGGDALIPGTGFLEIAREAASRLLPGAGAIELRDVVFLAPFAVPAGARRTLRVSVEDSGELTIEGRDERGDVVQHVTARAARVATSTTSSIDLAAIRVRCATKRPVDAEGFIPQSFMAFGPRWGNVVGVGVGAGESLIDLELPAAFAADLETHALHPALLDMATGGAQALVPGFDSERDFNVPFSYGRVVVQAPLPRRVSSHVRLRADSTKNTPTFDVTLTDEGGRVVVEITGFVMKRVGEGARIAAAPSASAGRNAAAAELRARATREGAKPAEGLDALERIVAARLGPQVVVSTLDLRAWMTATARASQVATEGTPAATSVIASTARPSVSTAFVAPRDENETRIAGLWRQMLGVDEIGVHDNFFELGGHSLLLTQTVTRLRKLAEIDLPLGELLSKLTVAEMAEAVARAKSAGPSAAPAPLRAVSRDAYRAKRTTATKAETE
ncbi:MAG TPA: SDR family NAD(P)-dependent oxidoreductase [Polyangia bacterium]|nr:SDR family NAD(P)-dependent oxidoreductase [Polyangia bacterium]